MATFPPDKCGHVVPLDRGKEVNQMLKLSAFLHVAADSLRRSEEGQTMAEYGVVLAVITLAVIAAITLLAGNVSNALNAVAGVLP
ncbi:MAG TPA: hypothetical protein VLD16_05400 [Gaiellaceae bacterium]|nr:hypothetical protein [Gaiellaceae bacterium]